MTARVHAVAGVLAIGLITTFLLSSLAVELAGDDAAVLAVRTAIVYALAVLVPCLIVAGGTGRALAAGRAGAVLRRKRRRTVAVSVLGAGVLVPCAVTLFVLARHGAFGAPFLVVQGVELAAGAVNLTLLGRNARDGRRMAAGRRRAGARPEGILGAGGG